MLNPLGILRKGIIGGCKNMRLPSDELLDEYGLVAPVADCPDILIYQSSRMMDLWMAWEEECDEECDIPFWAVAWPAAIVLTRYVQAHPDLVKGKSVLDLGCGCGLVSIACSLLGAGKVIANDTDEISLTMARANALVNEAIIDFNNGNLLTQEPFFSVEVVLIADMFYTREQARYLIQLLQRYKATGTRVLIADGGRNFVPSTGVHELYQENLKVDRQLEDTDNRTVRVLEFTG
jgi:predicted nicotinamide N-methyase